VLLLTLQAQVSVPSQDEHRIEQLQQQLTQVKGRTFIQYPVQAAVLAG